MSLGFIVTVAGLQLSRGMIWFSTGCSQDEVRQSPQAEGDRDNTVMILTTFHVCHWATGLDSMMTYGVLSNAEIPPAQIKLKETL